MQLSELLRSYRFFYTHLDIPSIDIPDSVTQFIDKFNKGETLTEVEFAEFAHHFNNFDRDSQNVLNTLLQEISQRIYLPYFEKLQELTMEVERSLSKGLPLPQYPPEKLEQYHALFNIYHVFTFNLNTSLNRGGFDSFVSGVPFGINVLRLIGKLPKFGDYANFSLSQSCWPLDLQTSKNAKAPLRAGMQDSSELFPYQNVEKIARGDVGNHTFLATNGVDDYYIRGVEAYSPEAVLSSKIATLVSETHFASETLMDNHLVSSKRLATYVRSCADRTTRDARKKYIEDDQRVFPGSGIIEEVCNFIHESDPNPENFGFSTDVINDETFLCKIDYDRCVIATSYPKIFYSGDILTGTYTGIYHRLPFIQNDVSYIKEVLTTRLKLAMLTRPIFSELAASAYLANDDEAKILAIQACVSRSDDALALFLEDPKVTHLIQEEPSLLVNVLAQLTSYIDTHFDPSIQAEMLASIHERVGIIQPEWDKIAAKPPLRALDAEAISSLLREIPPYLELISSEVSYNQDLFILVAELNRTELVHEHPLLLDVKKQVIIFHHISNTLIKNMSISFVATEEVREGLRSQRNEILKSFIQVYENYARLVDRLNQDPKWNQGSSESFKLEQGLEAQGRKTFLSYLVAPILRGSRYISLLKEILQHLNERGVAHNGFDLGLLVELEQRTTETLTALNKIIEPITQERRMALPVDESLITREEAQAAKEAVPSPNNTGYQFTRWLYRFWSNGAGRTSTVLDEKEVIPEAPSRAL